MSEFIKYPSIEQFRNIVKEVKFITGETSLLPTLTFTGTVKLHGTNAGISFNTVTGELWFQSRNNIITPEKDNAGFAKWGSYEHFAIKRLIDKYINAYGLSGDVTLFGEWCGGNIQPNIGIYGLDKMFVLFGVKCEDEWVPIITDVYNDDVSFFNVNLFPTYKIRIDFNDPQASTNELIAITEQVEAKCPAAKYFGLSGIGEGVVWLGNYGGDNLRFKVKGEKHSTTKVKKLAQVDPEKINSINEFVDYVITDNRMNQAVEQVFTTHSKEPDIKEMGLMIKWVMSDVFKEDKDTLTTSNLTSKDVTKQCVAKIRHWFILHLDSNL
jgi:hypothetical protein